MFIFQFTHELSCGHGFNVRAQGSSHHNIHTSSVAYSCSYRIGIGGALLPEMKWPECAVDHTASLSMKVKNMLTYTSISLICFHGMVLWQRGFLTFISIKLYIFWRKCNTISILYTYIFLISQWKVRVSDLWEDMNYQLSMVVSLILMLNISGFSFASEGSPTLNYEM
jgi:hypothetical protein